MPWPGIWISSGAQLRRTAPVTGHVIGFSIVTAMPTTEFTMTYTLLIWDRLSRREWSHSINNKNKAFFGNSQRIQNLSSADILMHYFQLL